MYKRQGLNASCELVSENYGDINTSIFPKTAEDADAITTSDAYATFKNSGYGGLFNICLLYTSQGTIVGFGLYRSGTYQGTETKSQFGYRPKISETVSYTHLDVYKRQGLIHERSDKREGAASK